MHHRNGNFTTQVTTHEQRFGGLGRSGALIKCALGEVGEACKLA